MKKFLSIVCLSFSIAICTYGQITLTGNVKNSKTGDQIPAVSITIKNTNTGTFTNDKGFFSLKTNQKLPVSIIASCIGFETQEIEITNIEKPITILFNPNAILGQDVVVSATRIATKTLESPVTIEHISAANIRQMPTLSFYDGLNNLKGVDAVNSSMNFKTISSRGFNGPTNIRLTQIVDGMNNQFPGLWFAFSNLVSAPDIDVDNVELLPGASSALYGSGGVNGTLLITSKDPFKYQGLSVQVTQGIKDIDNYQQPKSTYYDFAIRYAKSFNNRFAFKVVTQYTQSKDWLANDQRNIGPLGKPTTGDRNSPSYNGVNIYGDEVNFNVNPFIRMTNPGLVATTDSIVSRTGYKEKDLANFDLHNLKLNTSLHYKINDSTDLSFTNYFGTGTTVSTGAQSRFLIDNFNIGQYKLELKNKNYFVRAYTTQGRAGDAYDLGYISILINEKSSPTSMWAPDYANAYISARQAGETEIQAHNTARATADVNRLLPSTSAFQSAIDELRQKPNPQGAKIVDKTNLYAFEGLYNFKNIIHFADIQAGFLYTRYRLNSDGIVYSDTAGRIPINVYGGFIQASKWLANNYLKLTAALRYDKCDNFTGRFTPRLTALIKLATDNNIRLSLQTAYRLPTSLEQYVNLNAGPVKVLGGIPSLRDQYHFNTNPGYDVNAQGPPTPYQFKEFKPESVISYEIGYKGLIQKKILVDFYTYYAEYTNFISSVILIQNPGMVNQALYSITVNSDRKVKAYGSGLSINYLLPKNFILNANITHDVLTNTDPTKLTYFNTPKWRYNISFGNNNILKRYGFNITGHWQTAIEYQSSFVSGTVPAYGAIDAQINIKFPTLYSIIKIGGTNIFNKYYYTGIANPQIGGLYYISLGYNIL